MLFDVKPNNLCVNNILQDFVLMKKIYPAYPNIETKNSKVKFNEPGDYKNYSYYFNNYPYTINKSTNDKPLFFIFCEENIE